MADLLATQAGREILNRAACFLGRQFSSRKMQTAFWHYFKQWESTGYFDKAGMLGAMNPEDQDNIESLNALLASLGCLDVVETSMNIYVDPVNGSDVTGNGSEDYPFASMAFLNTFPKEINAFVRVFLLNDLDMVAETLNLNFSLGTDGCFSIAGVGAFNVVTTSGGAGPFTVTGVAASGAVPNDYGWEIQAAVGWTNYELVGKWLRFDTGANAGEAYPINTNDTTHAFIRGGLEAAVVNGDTFSIVEPAITLSCATINIEITGPDNVYPVTYDASRFNLLNMNINLDGPPIIFSRNFVLNSEIESQISFVTIISESQSEPVFIESNLNRYRSVDGDVATYAQSTVHNLDGAVSQGSPCGLLVYNPNPGSIYTYNSVIIKGAEFVRCVECYGVVEITKSHIDIELCGFGQLRGDGGASCQLHRSVLSAGGVDAIKLLYCGEWKVQRVVFSDALGASNLLWITVGVVHLFPDTMDITSGFGMTGYTIYHNRGNAQIFCNTDPAALIGGSGAIWYSGGVGATAFPVADAMASDALGNTFSYISTP